MIRTLKFRAWDSYHNVWTTCRYNTEIENNIPIFYLMGQSHVEYSQFTGLLDKNGKEIYEGDILGGSFDDALEVYFNEEYAQFQLRSKDSSGYGMSGINNKEIIGNIYQNLELIKTYD